MKNYELMTIANANLTEDKAKAVSKEIQDLIVAQKGEVTKTDFWGKRKLAYEMEGHRDGFYDVIYFNMSADGVVKLTSKLKLMENLIRYLVTAQS